MLEGGISMKFENNRAVISKDKLIIAIAHRYGNFFQAKLQVHNNSANLTKSENGDLWHKRLGHISNGSLDVMMQHMVSGISNVSINNLMCCEVCAQSKLCRVPFNGSRPKSSRALDHIHSDVCGPIDEIAYDGSKYFVSFIDDFTHFTMVYPIAKK